MKNDRYFKLRIPFGTRGHIKQNFDSIVIKGDAIFVFDRYHNHYIDEYLEIEKANFRLTDLNMIIPTVYYKNKLVKEFRDQYLDQWSNHDPKMIRDESRYQELTNEQIKIINDFFKRLNKTIKIMFSLLSGSNISGAETDSKASPLRCIDNDFFDCNFANPLKQFKAKNKELTKNYPDNLPIYTLMDIWNNNLIDGFKEIFIKYNPDHEILYAEHSDDLIEYPEDNLINVLKQNKDKHNQNNLDKKTFEPPENQDLYLDGLKNKTLDNYEKLIANNYKLVKEKLRAFYSANVKFCIANQIIPLKSMTKPEKHYVIESAHIFSFAEAIRKKEYYKAIDPFNCLRLDRNIHALFDRLKIYFDEDGNVCSSVNNEIWISKYIDIENMHSKTKEYFNEQILKDFHKN